MMFFLKENLDLNILVLVIAIFFMRMAFPFANYIFIPYSVFVIIFFLYKYLHNLHSLQLAKFIRFFSVFLILSSCFLLSLLRGNYNSLIIKEVGMLILVAVFIFIAFTEIKDIDEFRKFTTLFIKQVIFLSTFISILGVAKFILVLSGKNFLLSDNNEFNTSINSDYNFFALYSVLGIISILFAIVSFGDKTNKLIQISLFIQFLCLFLSGSRRGFIVYIILLLVIFLTNLTPVNRIRLNTKLFVYLTCGFFLMLVLFFSSYNTSFFKTFKRTQFNVNFINHTFFRMMTRYTSFLNLEKDAIEKIVGIKCDSRYPYTRWGTRIHKEVYPLKGLNSQVIPSGCVGYQLDSTCNASSWNGNAYAYTSLNPLFSGNRSKKEGNKFLASVYCYVSSDYNGSGVWLAAEGKVNGNIICFYDTLKKGEWQKLQIDFSFDNGLAPVYMYMSKNGQNNFGNLRGNVIFAYPVYLEAEHSSNSTLLLYKLENNKNSFRSSLFNLSFLSIKKFEFKLLKYFQEQFILKDGAELSIPRYERLRYSIHLFTKEYTLSQKLFGGGYGYMEKFGKKFGSVELDYPHNPIISSFLYSGIAGGMLYVLYLLLGFYLYLKHLKFHKFFFVCYIIVFFFSIISANTHFSIPVFTFLSLVPFLTHALVQKERIKVSHEA